MHSSTCRRRNGRLRVSQITTPTRFPVNFPILFISCLADLSGSWGRSAYMLAPLTLDLSIPGNRPCTGYSRSVHHRRPHRTRPNLLKRYGHNERARSVTIFVRCADVDFDSVERLLSMGLFPWEHSTDDSAYIAVWLSWVGWALLQVSKCPGL